MELPGGEAARPYGAQDDRLSYRDILFTVRGQSASPRSWFRSVRIGSRAKCRSSIDHRPRRGSCDALESETRLSVAVEGAPKSVGSTGSQTTNTRIRESGCWSSSFPNAEAPCRHTAQVGDTSTRTRTELAEVLKASLSDATFAAFKRTSGGWPCGVALPP